LQEVNRQWEVVDEGRTEFVEGNVTLAHRHGKFTSHAHSINLESDLFYYCSAWPRVSESNSRSSSAYTRTSPP
jgi:hypothetical protein